MYSQSLLTLPLLALAALARPFDLGSITGDLTSIASGKMPAIVPRLFGGVKFSGVTVFGDSFSDSGEFFVGLRSDMWLTFEILGSGPGSAWEFTNHTYPQDPA